MLFKQSRSVLDRYKYFVISLYKGCDLAGCEGPRRNVVGLAYEFDQMTEVK